MQASHGLGGLIYPAPGKGRRASSWDRSGGNADFISIVPGATAVIASLAGAGCIRHVWMTALSDDEYYLRRSVLRMFWDGETQPSVEVPLGDFFGVGHGRVSHYVSQPLNMITGAWGVGARQAAMNCFFPMPFAHGAVLSVQNESSEPLRSLYFYVDYEAYDDSQTAEDLLRFHAQWRRANPTQGTMDMSAPGANVDRSNVGRNLDGEGNYVILEAGGRGHYVGCNLSIDHINPIPGFAWFGEGDDMIWIDDDLQHNRWPPTLHGTGTEDYFCAAWGFPTGQYSGLYHGVSLAGPVEGDDAYSGKWTVYRFHIEDPIRFERCIRVTIEHGHANCQSNDYSSTAYWYQSEPHGSFPALPPAKDRLPLADEESLRQFRATLEGK